jgi:hypothetical protein
VQAKTSLAVYGVTHLMKHQNITFQTPHIYPISTTGLELVGQKIKDAKSVPYFGTSTA